MTHKNPAYLVSLIQSSSAPLPDGNVGAPVNLQDMLLSMAVDAIKAHEDPTFNRKERVGLTGTVAVKTIKVCDELNPAVCHWYEIAYHAVRGGLTFDGARYSGYLTAKEILNNAGQP